MMAAKPASVPASSASGASGRRTPLVADSEPADRAPPSVGFMVCALAATTPAASRLGIRTLVLGMVGAFVALVGGLAQRAEA